MTTRRLTAILAASTAISLIAEIIWMAVGLRYFNAKEADVPWYEPTAEFITLIFVLSLLGLVVTSIAVFMEWKRDH